jgi:fimbrial chaperone protein
MFPTACVYCFFCFAFLFFGASSGYSASLTIAPTRIEIPAPQPGGIITLQNNEDHPVAVQMRLFRWTHDSAGQEKLDPKPSMVAVSPPLVKIPPKARYSIRVVRLSTEPLLQEEAYRLYIDEIPTSSKNVGNQVSIAMRYNLPVIFMPSGHHHEKLIGFVEKKGGRTVLVLRNEGTRYAHISAIKLQQGTVNVDIPVQGTNTVLAHSSRTFDVSQEISRFKKGHPLTISIEHKGDKAPFQVPFSF